MGSRVAAALLALALLPALAACEPIRGVDPKLAPRYQSNPDGNFACLDGKKVVPFTQVNDDFCDCLDGSDEPGTSACPNGHFYCENKFYLPLLLNSSMVDDGICDCCDGSDEPAGRCQNECYNKGYESLAALKGQVEAADKGVQARAAYIQQAAASMQQWAERRAVVDSDLETGRLEKEAVEAEKQKLEEEERKLRERKDELEEQRKKLEAPVDTGAAQQAGEEAVAAVADETAAGGEEGGAGDGDGGQAEGEEEVAGKSEAELARERMAQWIPGALQKEEGQEEEAAQEGEEPAPPVDDAEHAVSAQEDAAAVEEGQELEAGGEEKEQQFFRDQDGGSDGGASGADGDGGAGGGDGSATAEEDGQEARPATAFGKARLLITKVVQALAAAAKRATGAGSASDELAAAIANLDDELEVLEARLIPLRSKAEDRRGKVSELEREQRELAEKLAGDYGAGEAYVALVDRCFTAQVDKYTYEVCPFSKASQKEGHSTTSLGTWSGFEQGHTRMAFRDGQACWQGPNRSMTVTLLCGQTERLARVEEPSRCEYTAELETPAACTPETAEALRREVAARLRFLEGDGEPPAPQGGEEAAVGQPLARDEL